MNSKMLQSSTKGFLNYLPHGSNARSKQGSTEFMVTLSTSIVYGKIQIEDGDRSQYTTFILADSARVLDRVACKQGQKGQTFARRPSSFAMAYTSNISSPTFLTENDMPGASLMEENLRS